MHIFNMSIVYVPRWTFCQINVGKVNQTNLHPAFRKYYWNFKAQNGAILSKIIFNFKNEEEKHGLFLIFVLYSNAHSYALLRSQALSVLNKWRTYKKSKVWKHYSLKLYPYYSV